MKRTMLLMLTAGLLAGCQNAQPEYADWTDDDRRSTNEWMLRTYFNDQVEAAVVRQHTLHPHQFVDGTAELNPRGERDLAILAGAYAERDGGVLIMPRGGIDHGLYQRRVSAVHARLSLAGVEPARVQIHEGVWTGETTGSPRAGADFARPSEERPYEFHSGEGN